FKAAQKFSNYKRNQPYTIQFFDLYQANQIHQFTTQFNIFNYAFLPSNKESIFLAAELNIITKEIKDSHWVNIGDTNRTSQSWDFYEYAETCESIKYNSDPNALRRI